MQSSPTTPSTVQLSVVIACFNAQDTLGEQLQALVDQAPALPDGELAWEVLVCDNGSTDSSRQVAASFADRLPLRVIDASARRGPGAARNAGAQVARGQWLAFCDADDVVAFDWLAQLCMALSKYAFVAGRFDGERLNRVSVARSRQVDQSQTLQRSGNGLWHAGASNMGVHASVFAEVGGFDESLRVLEDTDLCWRIQRAGVPLVFVPQMLMHVRLRGTWRGMYVQGRSYGRAHALLQQREGSAGRGSGLSSSEGRGGPVATQRDVMGRIRSWTGKPASLRHVVWQWAWHAGYRSAKRT